ncbi:MAG: ATP-NAD kinase family protein [Alsobacter sp.]
MRSKVRLANISHEATRRRRIGLIVNPIAGMGGPLGLKGTDGAETLCRALAMGAVPRATERAARALDWLAPLAGGVDILAGAGAMGADLAASVGFRVEAVGEGEGPTTGAHSRAAAEAMQARGVDLLLFAGGDGTARDVFDGAPDTPLLGIPTGVKMHSAVFAVSPAAAGRIAVLAVGDTALGIRWRQGEVMDLDEDELRAGRVAGRLHGFARVPIERMLMQNCKAGSGRVDEDVALAGLADRIVHAMEPGTVQVLGCGQTMRLIKRRLGGEGTLLGVDVALDGRLIATDVDEERLLRLVEGVPARVTVGVTGGQGFVFGRGNQQIGPAVLALVGRDGVTVVTSQAKLTALDPACLRVDTGDSRVDAMLSGYLRVHTAPGRSMMMRVAA